MSFVRQARIGRQAVGATIVIGVLGIASFRLNTRAQAPAPVFANFEEAQTNPVRLSVDGTRLFAVNTANASLSVFDVTTPGSPSLIAEIPVGLGPVSVNPLTDDEAWVVNQVSNSISIVSVSKGIVVNTIYVKTEPMDVVFAGTNQAYISVSRSSEIAVVDTNTGSPITTLFVFGDNPRALAVSPDGTMVYAAFALSGNATTIIPESLAPVQCGVKGQTVFNPAQCVPAFNTVLPAPPKVALIVAATDPNWTSYVKFKMPDNDVVAIKTGATPSIAGYYSGVGTVNLGLAVNPVTGDLFVANTDALNLTAFQPNLDGHWVNNRITQIQVATGKITPFDLNPNINYSILPNPAALSTALAQPAGVVFDPGGSFMYVASFGTDRVARVDTNGNVIWFVEVDPQSTGSNVDSATKRGPRGLALNAAAQTLYSLNRISNTISVINTGLGAVTSEIAVGTDPTPPLLKAGRGFLYDAKLSGNGTGSCASCHVDGDMDHLAWNLGDPTGSMTSTVQNGTTILFHPMKGPMTTQTLRGLLNLSPYHWRGDKVNFAAFNVAFNELMGGSQISNSAMSVYTNFANSILFLPNPYQNLDRTLPTSLNGGNPVNGQSDFLTIAETGSATGTKATCNQCHTSNPGPGSNRLISNTTPQPLKIPELRNIYQKQLYNRFGATTIDGFGMAHDGAISGFKDFFSESSFAGYSATQGTDIAAYNLCFDTGTAPAVGFTITLIASTVGNSAAQADWATLQSQASAGNVDLIGRGTIQGEVHGLLYQPASSNYISDTSAVYTQAQLQALIAAGDTLSMMGVYPGTGSASTQP
jgi:YVTN family beta-propeller protein